METLGIPIDRVSPVHVLQVAMRDTDAGNAIPEVFYNVVGSVKRNTQLG